MSHTISVVHARFYAPDAEQPGQTIRLPGEEAEHLTRVLRLHIGDTVRVFNGRGGEFLARVARSGRQDVTLALEATATPGIEPRIRVTLIQAVLKSDAMDTVIRDAVMMGVAALQPVVSARSETTMAALERGRRQERWTRIAVASAKQCGRATMPVLHAPVAFGDAVTRLAADLPAPAVMFVEPGASAAAVPLHALSVGKAACASIVIGPEGGWTAGEIASASARVQLVTMRLPTIRASVMATVACAALLSTWGEI